MLSHSNVKQNNKLISFDFYFISYCTKRQKFIAYLYRSIWFNITCSVFFIIYILRINRNPLKVLEKTKQFNFRVNNKIKKKRAMGVVKQRLESLSYCFVYKRFAGWSACYQVHYVLGISTGWLKFYMHNAHILKESQVNKKKKRFSVEKEGKTKKKNVNKMCKFVCVINFIVMHWSQTIAHHIYLNSYILQKANEMAIKKVEYHK